MDLKILVGSQTGNAMNLASSLAESIVARGFDVEVWNMGDHDPQSLESLTLVLIVTSTYGDGEPPDNASEWMSFLRFGDEVELSHLRYAVLGLGDTYYPHFCQAGKDFDRHLRERGAIPVLPRLDCDLYYEEQYGEWFEEFIGKLALTSEAP